VKICQTWLCSEDRKTTGTTLRSQGILCSRKDMRKDMRRHRNSTTRKLTKVLTKVLRALTGNSNSNGRPRRKRRGWMKRDHQQGSRIEEGGRSLQVKGEYAYLFKYGPPQYCCDYEKVV
jgi:hypothetical protein